MSSTLRFKCRIFLENKKGLNEFIDYLRFTAELEEIEISALQGPVGHIGVSWDKLKFPEKWDQKWDQK